MRSRTAMMIRVFIAIILTMRVVLFFYGSGVPQDEFTVAGAPFVVGGADLTKVTAERRSGLADRDDGFGRRHVHSNLKLKRVVSVRVRSRTHLYLVIALFLGLAVLSPTLYAHLYSFLIRMFLKEMLPVWACSPMYPDNGSSLNDEPRCLSGRPGVTVTTLFRGFVKSVVCLLLMDTV